MGLDWQQRVEALYSTLGNSEPERLVAEVKQLVAELPEGDPAGLFELAGAYDYTGQEAAAEPLYRRALALGLPSPQRRQAVIQLASTLRNLGKPGESADLLKAELSREPEDEHTGQLHDDAVAFLALALVDLGQEREAAGLALAALLPHLRLYRKSLARYAEERFGDRGEPATG